MHTSFYASGFLYHPRTKQILLQQLQSDDNVKLVLFRGSGHNGKDPQAVFQKTVEELLGVHCAVSSIHPVYDYIHDKLGEHFIFYMEIGGKSPKTYASKNKTGWFLLSKLSKLTMSEQTRHDIIVGERVIRSLVDASSPSSHYKHN
ncbi:NUDIX hydrolase [Candidatus Gottesmanbacteria bacterium]|nr:NUDIX hydrolase [Candidatus Gottesmanbacteria bacterium]